MPQFTAIDPNLSIILALTLLLKLTLTITPPINFHPNPLPVPAQVVGDDLLVTNPKRVKQGIDGKWCNALLLKVNQIGSLTESINAVRLVVSA